MQRRQLELGRQRVRLQLQRVVERLARLFDIAQRELHSGQRELRVGEPRIDEDRLLDLFERILRLVIREQQSRLHRQRLAVAGVAGEHFIDHLVCARTIVHDEVQHRDSDLRRREMLLVLRQLLERLEGFRKTVHRHIEGRQREA